MQLFLVTKWSPVTSCPSLQGYMLSAPTAPTVDISFDDDRCWSSPPARLYRTASVGNSWGVTDIGRGFDSTRTHHSDHHDELRPPLTISTQSPLRLTLMDHPLSFSPSHSPSTVLPPPSLPSASGSPRAPHSPSRPRRRSSQQRVSLVAGRVLIAPIDPPSPPQDITPLGLRRAGSVSSLLSSAASTAPPSPLPERESFLGTRSISEFLIEAEIGRGAYGLVKRARDISNGSFGVRPASVLQHPSLNSALASARYQTNHQISNTCRLLEKTSYPWNHPHRNLCHVRYIIYSICITTSSTLGSIST